ncbi:MAG TPA: exodeoxyribonuclease V subunit gamma, partial [Spirochaetota bacterium]|nr:exodeoxyribonuclease V subunit gamma [Spirochaetota bacterium]
DFFDPDEESARDLDAVRVFAARLPEVATGSDVDGTVSARLLAAFMADAIGASRGGGEFITGRLTFCALMPMRSVPFRVVCMIGMNDASFPRRDVPAGFNRIADEFRPGDRSLRDEDRYLFLESILSARDRLYISYCGQGVQDNRPIPPSIVVSELVDYIEQGHPECKPLVTRHPLQAFSPRYFRDDGALYTFSETQSAAARALLSRTAPPSFFPGPLIALPTEEREIALDTLAGFFTNPARALLEKRLGVRYGPIAGELRDEEPFTLEGIDAWRVNRHVLEGVLRGDSLDAIVDGLAARGELPHGGIGRGMVDALARGASAFHRALLPFLPEGDPPPRPFSLTIGAYRIVGAVPVPGPRGLTTYRYARCRASDRLRAWIAHCIMLLLDPASSGVSHFISLREKKDEIARFEMDAFDDAGGYLAGLMDLYDAGMRGPLPFFPRSSLVYAEEAARGKLSEPDARARARDAWLGSEFARGDADDEYVARLFSGADPIDARFAECARHVFMPMLAHQSEAKP